jgi:hypothetical protein
MVNSQNTWYFIKYHKWHTIEGVRSVMRMAIEILSPECLLTSQKHAPNHSGDINMQMHVTEVVCGVNVCTSFIWHINDIVAHI